MLRCVYVLDWSTACQCDFYKIFHFYGIFFWKLTTKHKLNKATKYFYKNSLLALCAFYERLILDLTSLPFSHSSALCVSAAVCIMILMDGKCERVKNAWRKETQSGWKQKVHIWNHLFCCTKKIIFVLDCEWQNSIRNLDTINYWSNYYLFNDKFDDTSIPFLFMCFHFRSHLLNENICYEKPSSEETKVNVLYTHTSTQKCSDFIPSMALVHNLPTHTYND